MASKISFLENIIVVKRTRRHGSIKLKKFRAEAKKKLSVLNIAMVTADVREMWRLIKMQAKTTERTCSLTGVSNKVRRTTNNLVKELNI